MGVKSAAVTLPEIFIPELRIKRKVARMAHEISSDFLGGSITVIYVSNGAMIFTADLVRKITVPVRIDSISAFSYSDTESTGRINIRSFVKLDIKGRNVLIVDDILDTGRTLSEVKGKLERFCPADIKTCVLLDKPSRRKVNISADYVGFKVPDVFLIGYGLDYNEQFRNLPYLGIMPKIKQ